MSKHCQCHINQKYEGVEKYVKLSIFIKLNVKKENQIYCITSSVFNIEVTFYKFIYYSVNDNNS